MRLLDVVSELHAEDIEVPDDTNYVVPVRSKIQRWAAENAYTLIFLSAMFVVTWIILTIEVFIGR